MTPALASILPFLANLKKGDPDFSGMTSDDDPETLANGPSRIARSGNMLPTPQGPPAPPPPDQMPQADPNAIPQTPLDLSGIGTDTGDERAPKYQEAKGHLLMRILQSGVQGGLNGMASNAQTYAATGRNAGFGGGFAGAQTFPLGVQREQLQNQQLIQMLPFLRSNQIAGLQKTQSEINKNNAEAGAIPIKSQLENAQALAARYKEDPGSGTLIDLQTGQPVSTQGLAPLSDQEATILGKQPGERVPLKIKNSASEMVNRGIHTVQANGRSLLVDNQGNTIKDMGTATPLAVIGQQMASGQVTPDMQTAAQAVAQGKIDLPTAIRPYTRFPGQANAFMSEVLRQNPNFSQANFGVSKKTMEYFTTGAGATQLTAFRTAINHADLLSQAAQALNNGDSRTLNSIVKHAAITVWRSAANHVRCDCERL